MECPYCQSQVVLKDSRIIYRTRSYGLAWVCERYPACAGELTPEMRFGLETTAGKYDSAARAKIERRRIEFDHELFAPLANDLDTFDPRKLFQTVAQILRQQIELP